MDRMKDAEKREWEKAARKFVQAKFNDDQRYYVPEGCSAIMPNGTTLWIVTVYEPSRMSRNMEVTVTPDGQVKTL